MLIFKVFAKLFIELCGKLGDYIAVDITICAFLKAMVSVFNLSQYNSLRQRDLHLAQIEKIQNKKKEKNAPKAIAAYLSSSGYPIFGFAIGHFLELALCALAAASFYPRFALFPEGATIMNGLINLQDRPTNIWFSVGGDLELLVSVILFTLAVAAQVVSMRRLNSLLVVEHPSIDNLYLLLVVVATVLLPIQFCLLWTLIKILDTLFLVIFCKPKTE